jgi:hypothetical protein
MPALVGDTAELVRDTAELVRDTAELVRDTARTGQGNCSNDKVQPRSPVRTSFCEVIVA